jgi:hypothetical protein
LFLFFLPFVWSPCSFLEQAAHAADTKKIEEVTKKIQILTQQLAACGTDTNCVERVSAEMRRAIREMPDPMEGFTSVPAGGGLEQVRVRCTVKIVNRAEYQKMDKGPGANWACEKGPLDRIYPSVYWLFEYEAQEDGYLDYLSDFSRFALQSPPKGPYAMDSPGKFKILQKTGYRQGWGRGSGGNCVLKNYPDGAFLRIDSGNKTFSFMIQKPTPAEKVFIYFGPIAILVDNADKSCPDCSKSTYFPDKFNSENLSEYQHSPSDFVITPADMQAALKAGRFERSWRWRQTIDDYGGYQDNRLTVTIEFQANPGRLAVTPAEGFQSAGPDKTGQFIPNSKTYTVKNIGGSLLQFGVSKTQNWLNLSSTGGQLGPGESATVTASIAPSAKNLPANTYNDDIQLTNQTNSQGNTTRPVKLDVGEIQVWEVKMTGQETDDMGGNLMYIKMKDVWKMINVDYGVRFDYTMTARFTIKKEPSAWKYISGEILSGQVGYSTSFDPDVFNVVKIVCKNCQDVPNMKGMSLTGELQGNAVRLIWPSVVTRVIVTNSLKIKTYQPKDKSQSGYSDNYFESSEFFDRARDHVLPLKDGDKEFKVPKTSAIAKFKEDKRPQVTISYRYLLKRIE